MRSTSTEDLGEPLQYDPDFNGPLKRRSCTDIICLLIFLVFVACWVGIGLYAYKNGDPATLLVPKDSTGSRCGIDSHVRDKPYLFFFDLTKCLDPTVPFTGCKTTQVCVTQCPSTNYFRNPDGAYGGSTEYCNTDIDVNDCPYWYLESTVFFNRCLYNVADRKRLNRLGVSEVKGDEISVMKSLLNPFHMWTSLVVQNVLSYFTENENVHKIGQNVIEDIVHSWWKILIGVGLSLLACIIYIIMLRWIAGPIVWLSIIGAIIGLGFCLYFSTIKYIEFRDKYNKEIYEEVKSGYKTKRDLWLAGLIIVSIVLGIILLMLIFLRKRIILAIALVKEGSKAVSSVTASLFFPIFPWVLQLGVIAYAIFVGVYLTSTGDPIYKTRYINNETCQIGFQDNVECDPDIFRDALAADTSPGCQNATCKFIRMENSVFYPYLQAVNVFGFFWLVFFVSALGQMVLAGVFAQWYWTFHKSALPFFALTAAFYRTLRYHLGTIAFGSLIIAICRMIRVFLEYLDHKLKKYDNELVKAILCCLKCFFWCLEKFLKFINKNAYIMCAIHGKNFCASAKDAFLLLMRNIVRVFVLDKVTDFLFFLSKLLVTMGVGAVSYVIFATDLTSIDNSSLNYGVVPVIIIMICTYLISSVFFSVYSMAVDTLFLCFLEDCERNDGSAEKPYFMSKNLMKIFGKKNHLS